MGRVKPALPNSKENPLSKLIDTPTVADLLKVLKKMDPTTECTNRSGEELRIEIITLRSGVYGPYKVV